MDQVTQREWRWVAAMASLVVAASTLPYLTGYLAQTEDMRFGGALLDRMDYHSHLAKMWQGYRGQWQYRLLFTPEGHQGVYLQTFYVALGHLARLYRLELPLAYQLARLACAFGMLLVLYRFIAQFLMSPETRRVAFLLATAASGLGWLTEAVAPTPPGGVSPMDFWLLDGLTYLALLTSPHFCAAIGLLLAVFLLLLHRPAGPSLGQASLAVLASLALGCIHPYLLLVVDMLPLLYWTVEGLRTRQVAWAGLATVAAMLTAQAPLLAYQAWVFGTQPVFAAWAAQNVTLSPGLPVYLEGYGVLLTLGAIGTAVWARRGGDGLALPLLWLAWVAVLVYLPWNLQRRFLEGVPVPLGMLAGVGLAEGLIPRDRERRRIDWGWLARWATVVLTAASNLYLTGGLVLATLGRAPSLFWPVEVLAGVDWLGEHSGWQETVLAGPQVGGLIPARIGHRVVLGHPMETVDYEGKRVALARFFASDMSDAERLALVREWGVCWLFYGPQEQALSDFDPATVSWLAPAFRTGPVAVYRVTLGEGRTTLGAADRPAEPVRAGSVPSGSRLY